MNSSFMIFVERSTCSYFLLILLSAKSNGTFVKSETTSSENYEIPEYFYLRESHTSEHLCST